MKFIIALTAGIVTMCASIIILTHWINSNTITVQYNCGMLIGGWHPDVPPEVQRLCKQRKGN